MSQHMAVELLSSYLDEEVTQAQLRLVEDHLRGCSECRGTLAGLSSISASVRRLEAVAPPSTLAVAVERRVRRAALEEPRGLRFEQGLKRWMGQPVLAPVFAIVLALGAILYLFASGVSEVRERPTRFVIASAPAAEEQETSELRQDSADELGVSDSGLVGAASPAAEARVQEPSLDRDTADSRTSSSRDSTPPESHGRSEDDSIVERRDRLRGELKVVLEEGKARDASISEAVVADVSAAPERVPASSAAAKAEAGGRAAATPVPTLDSSMEDSSANEVGQTRTLAGRRFVKTGDVWLEVGLEGQPADELVDLRTGVAEIHEDLAAFQDLERVRLRIGDRIVEVIYAPEPGD